MELVGERWSMLVIRELMFGGRRFSELRASLPGISAKVLTERLAGLEAAGAVRKVALPSPANVQVYELTEWGQLAEPAIQELGRWAATHVAHDPTLPLSPVSLMLSLRTMLDKEKARHLSATVGFEVAGESYVATVKDGTMPIVRGPTAGADVVVRAPAAPLVAAMIYLKVPPAGLAGQGLTVEGDPSLFARFIDLFHLPQKVG
ncbi:winged helix-turn-helix transcriptional regulator [Tsuneonella sp. HG222]